MGWRPATMGTLEWWQRRRAEQTASRVLTHKSFIAPRLHNGGERPELAVRPLLLD
jgi:hypothetical protein